MAQTKILFTPEGTTTPSMALVATDANGNLIAASNVPSNIIATPITKKTASYAMTSADATILADATAAAVTVTLPPAPSSGQIFNVKKIDSTTNAVTVVGANSATIDGFTSVLLGIQNATGIFQFDGSVWWML